MFLDLRVQQSQCDSSTQHESCSENDNVNVREDGMRNRFPVWNLRDDCETIYNH